MMNFGWQDLTTDMKRSTFPSSIGGGMMVKMVPAIMAPYTAYRVPGSCKERMTTRSPFFAPLSSNFQAMALAFLKTMSMVTSVTVLSSVEKSRKLNIFLSGQSLVLSRSMSIMPFMLL
ncbi:MAG: hypothetical protein BWX52_01928 [Bacteroidetes bacterium ADurb.Bin013]|nr:MAG: hypothetical protein BWX52_01928 [Bacteroidetes bacterium ADurb.Bin013]